MALAFVWRDKYHRHVHVHELASVILCDIDVDSDICVLFWLIFSSLFWRHILDLYSVYVCKSRSFGNLRNVWNAKKPRPRGSSVTGFRTKNFGRIKVWLSFTISYKQCKRSGEGLLENKEKKNGVRIVIVVNSNLFYAYDWRCSVMWRQKLESK